MENARKIFLLFRSMSRSTARSSLANSLYHNFTMLNNPDFLASNFLASNFSKAEELSRLAILSPTIIVYYNFPRPTIQINRFQLISSSLKNGTMRQTRFQNNHPRIIGEIKISFMWKLFRVEGSRSRFDERKNLILYKTKLRICNQK